MCRYPAVEDFPEAAEVRQIFAKAMADRDRRHKKKMRTSACARAYSFPSNQLAICDIQAPDAVNDNERL